MNITDFIKIAGRFNYQVPQAGNQWHSYDGEFDQLTDAQARQRLADAQQKKMPYNSRYYASAVKQLSRPTGMQPKRGGKCC